MDFRGNKKSKWNFLRPQAVALFAILQTMIFFFIFEDQYLESLEVSYHFLSVHGLPWGLPKVAKRFVWHLRPLEIFELENDSPGSFMHFQAMTFRKSLSRKKSESHWVLCLNSSYHRLFKKYKMDLWCCIMLEKYSLKVAVFTH